MIVFISFIFGVATGVVCWYYMNEQMDKKLERQRKEYEDKRRATYDNRRIY